MEGFARGDRRTVYRLATVATSPPGRAVVWEFSEAPAGGAVAARL